MGMGAPKPGSTLPPQGGKGGVQPPVQPTIPPQGTYPGMPLTPHPSSPYYFPNGPEPSAQALNQGKGQGVPMGGLLGGGGNPIQPQVPPAQPIPPQGSKGNMPLPEHYQSPFANYGFDPGLQSYLDQQMYRSYTDGGVGFQYDPTNQTFTGGTRSGSYNPIPLSVMQQAAGGNRDVLNPYFQSRFPQPTGPVPAVRPRPPVIQPGPNVFPRPQQPGLGGLQVNKFRNRLG